MNNFIQMPNNILETYKQNSLLPFAILLKKKLINNRYDLQFNYIFNQLKINRTNSYRQKIKNIFIQMQYDNIIVCDNKLDSITNNDLVEVEIHPMTKSFTQIAYTDIDKILEYDGNESKYNIFNVYWSIKKHLYYQDTIWTIEYEIIKQLTGIKHNETIKNIIDILVSMQLIIKDNVGYRVYWDGKIKNSSYTFANIDQQQLLDQEIIERQNEFKNQNIKIIKG